LAWCNNALHTRFRFTRVPSFFVKLSAVFAIVIYHAVKGASTAHSVSTSSHVVLSTLKHAPTAIMPIEPRYAYDRPTMRSSYEASYRMRTPRRPQLIDCRSASPSPLQKGPGPAHQSIKEGENREHGMNGAKWYPPVPKWSHGRMPLREITTEGPRVAGNRKQDAHNRSGVSGNHHDNNKEVNPSFRSNTGETQPVHT